MNGIELKIIMVASHNDSEGESEGESEGDISLSLSRRWSVYAVKPEDSEVVLIGTSPWEPEYASMIH